MTARHWRTRVRACVAAFVVVAFGAAAADTLTAAPKTEAGPAATRATYTCPPGGAVKVFDNSNIFGVLNGAKPPTFSTKGKAYCVTQVVTYHWNDAKGKRPGTIGLGVVSGAGGRGKTLGPWKAVGSSGQGGAPNVNWTATPPVGTVVIDGTYTCKDSDPRSWSQNPQTGGKGFCFVFGTPAVKSASPPPYTCSGAQVRIFDNSNTGGVLNGGTPPTFDTAGKAYCLNQIVTYHWNDAHGKAPGTIGLGVVQGLGGAGTTLGPWSATGSAGQGGAPNVNWSANVPATPVVVINGTYTCQDSDPATWSQNSISSGHGFCIVFGTPAVKQAPLPKPKPKPKPKPQPKPKPKPQPKPGPGKGGKGKLSLKASPDTGKPPLTVTFTITSPKVVQWRIDFGDGKSQVGNGSPPASITHTYTREGDYKARLTELAAPNAPAASSVTANVSVHAAQLISLKVNPESGDPPLKVTFSLQTTVKNITTWTLDFGDGQHTGGGGNPPASVTHTYAKNGSFRATFAVKPGQYALVFTVAQVTVGGGTPPILSLSASPTSGTHPLNVTFTIGVNIPGQIVSWQLKFGDGYTQGSSGRPPASVSHTYSKKGTYAAFLIVAQQQQYGGVQYVVPKGGLIVVVG